MAHAIGVDLGGSHVMSALVSEDGKIKKSSECDIVDRTFDVVLKQVASTIEDVLSAAKKSEVSAIGIGSPGNIDPTNGTITFSPNFNWRDAPLGPKLRELVGMPVLVGNDARCATLGEHTYGSGRGVANFVLLTLGTGIGGGIVAEGTLVIGNSAGAGEIGHHQIRATDGFLCTCGKIGCFEAQASGTGLLRHALSLAPSFPRSRLLGDDPAAVGSKSIRKAAAAGDPHAVATWNRYVDDLARGLGNIIAFLNPEMIALGGGVSAAGEFHARPVAPEGGRVDDDGPARPTKIVIAELGNDAGAIGAAVMARRGGLYAREPE